MRSAAILSPVDGVLLSKCQLGRVRMPADCNVFVGLTYYKLLAGVSNDTL